MPTTLPKLYAHPFSSYSQKALVALYENATPFDYRSLEDATANAELAALWPMKRFPVLVDGGACRARSYLHRRAPRASSSGAGAPDPGEP